MKFKNIKKYMAIGLAAFVASASVTGFNVTRAYATPNDGDSTTVSTSTEVHAPTIIVEGSHTTFHANAGETVDIKLPVRVQDFSLVNPDIYISNENEGTVTVSSTPELLDSNGSHRTYLNKDEHGYIHFTVKVSSSAAAKTYSGFTLSIGAVDSENRYDERTVKNISKLRIIVDKAKQGAKFTMSKVSTPAKVTPGSAFSVSFTIKNSGDVDSENTSVKISGFDASFITDDSTIQNLGTLKAGSTKRLTYKFTASETLAASGIVPIAVEVTSSSSSISSGGEGTSNSAGAFTVSVQTYVPEKEEAEVKMPTIQVIKTSYPTKVTANQKVHIAVTLRNTSNITAKDFIAEVPSFGDAALNPNAAYTKKRVKKLEPGDTVTLSYNLTAIDSFSDGIHPLEIKWSYYSVMDKKSEKQQNDSIILYMDGKAKEDDTASEGLNSVPKLMVADYDTGTDNIMAGKIFNFTMTIRNTHKKLSANNIQVTVSSADNTFSIVEGSASFMLDSLAAGEETKLTVPLKVKGDVATNGYDLKITFNYEYEATDPTINNGKTKVSKSNSIDETLKLQVYSNDRPQVSNISVGDGETPVNGQTTSVSFDFNNMGKSPLYNVTAKISGDLTPSGDMLIIGNVDPGTGKNWSIDVTPMVSGTANGTLTISYEDSNGNVSSYDTPFTTEVTDYVSDEPGTDVVIPTEDTTQKGLPKWAFILIEIALLLASIFITRSVYIKSYKKKAKEKLENSDDDDI